MINDEKSVIVRLRCDGIPRQIQDDQIIETFQTKDFPNVGNVIVT